LETGLLQRNRARVCLGHTASASFKTPKVAAKPGAQAL
jgi:hypothetical protein